LKKKNSPVAQQHQMLRLGLYNMSGGGGGGGGGGGRSQLLSGGGGRVKV